MADEIFTKEDAALEGETNVILDDLSAFEGDITVEQLRNIPGTGDLSDEELTKLWADAQKPDAVASTAKDGSVTTASTPSPSTGTLTPAQQRAWKLYGTDDKELAIDPGKMTLEQFLAAKIGYTANKAEQKKSLDELIRVAQFGHLNEQRFGTTKQERDQLFKELEEIRPAHQTMQQQQKQLLFALDQYIAGNQSPLKSLVEGYAKALAERNGPTAPRPEPAAAASNNDAEAAGMRVYYEKVIPAADAIAKQYNLQKDGVAELIMQFVNNEPAQFVTADKLQQIIEYDVPQYIERNGAAATAGNATPAATVPNAELEAMRKEIAALKAQQANSTVETVRTRNRRLPPNATGSNGNAGSSSFSDVGMKAEDLNDAASFKKFLKS